MLPRNNSTTTYQESSEGNIINITLTASTGSKIVIIDNSSLTVEQLLIKYVDKIGLPHNVIGKDIMFLYNGSQLDPKCQDTIGSTFQNGSNITVYDLNGIIGAYK